MRINSIWEIGRCGIGKDSQRYLSFKSKKASKKVKGGVDMKILKKRWMIITGIVFVAVLCVCLGFVCFAYQGVKKSVLGEMGIKRAVNSDTIYFKELDRRAQKNLSQEDRRKLLWLLSHTRKYDKEKDERYILEGYFLPGPRIVFWEEGRKSLGHIIYWNYTEATFYYSPPDTTEQKGPKYYLDEKYAKELKELFDKYINFPIKNL